MAIEPLSGAQCTLRTGDYVAEIASIGATLRALRYRGRDLIVPFGADEIRPGMRGAILAPWPNRTADGRYRFADAEHQLPINEIETNNASHGLVAWMRFEPVELASGSARLCGWIEPQPGYPWRVRLDVEYVLGHDGLSIAVVATNESSTSAPFGVGIHPYLLGGAPGRAAVDDWLLEAPVAEVILPDERMLPSALVPVAEHGALDFRSARRVGSDVLNHAFTSIARDEDGAARVRVVGDGGLGAEISWDEGCPWLQLYTSDESSSDEWRHAIAVEPQSCAPDALNSGRGLLALAPGASSRFSWRLRALG